MHNKQVEKDDDGKNEVDNQFWNKTKALKALKRIRNLTL